MKRFLGAFAAAVLFLTSAISALAASRDELTPADRVFFADLKRAVLAADAEWLAARASYPLRVQIENDTHTIANREEFIARFAEIVPVSIGAAINEQSAETLLKTERGIMVGDGEIWFKEVPSVSPIAKVSTHCITSISARPRAKGR